MNKCSAWKSLLRHKPKAKTRKKAAGASARRSKLTRLRTVLAHQLCLSVRGQPAPRSRPFPRGYASALASRVWWQDLGIRAHTPNIALPCSSTCPTPQQPGFAVLIDGAPYSLVARRAAEGLALILALVGIGRSARDTNMQPLPLQ